MAYDRFDTRDARNDERSRWSNDRDFDRDRDWRGEGRRHGGDPGERGFFERAGDEIASWFGDDDAERRRHRDQMRDGSDHGDHRHAQSHRHDQGRDWSEDRERDRSWNDNRGVFARGGSSDRDYNRNWQSGGQAQRERGYRPMTGDYGRGFGEYDRRGDPSDSEWGRDEYRSSSRAGTSDRSDRSRHERDFDPHYRSWRDRHMSELDRDYDDYRRDNQSRFESDFGGWRERRQQKRGLLGQIREHMEVVGNDDEHVGKVDKAVGDRVILTKSDPESGSMHHSLSCADIDRVEGDRVILDCSADEARNRWRDESRSRALFEREDRGEMGPRMLDRSFEGTYRR